MLLTGYDYSRTVLDYFGVYYFLEKKSNKIQQREEMCAFQHMEAYSFPSWNEFRIN